MSEKLKELVLFWNEKTAELLNMHTNPGHDTRRFAVVQIAIHDTLNYYEKRFGQFSQVVDVPRRFINNEPEEAVNTAAYTALKWAVKDMAEYNNKLRSENLPPIPGFVEQDCNTRIDGWYTEKKKKHDDNAILIGQLWAEAIINNREVDGSKAVNILSTTPADGGANEKGIFRADYYKFPPAVPADKNKLVVGYGDVAPFALTSAEQFRQAFNPILAGTTDFEEVKEKGSAQYTITDEDLKNKIEYWSTLKQHVIWNDIARKIILQYALNAWQMARLFAVMHTAMADGAISMFKDLYHYRHWRPVTGINDAAGINPFDPNAWKPRLAVPRVPEYPSVFGIFAGAVGQILELNFPAQNFQPIYLSFTNSAGVNKSVSYTELSRAVNDCSLTKIYCGWNFRKSAEDCITQGRLIGRYIYENKFSHIRKPIGPVDDRQPKPDFPDIPQLRR